MACYVRDQIIVVRELFSNSDHHDSRVVPLAMVAYHLFPGWFTNLRIWGKHVTDQIIVVRELFSNGDHHDNRVVPLHAV